MSSQTLFQSINDFKIGILQHKDKIYLRDTVTAKNFLDFLYKQKFITIYYHLPDLKKYAVVLKKQKCKSVFKTLITISKPGWKKPVTAYRLNTVAFKHSNSIFVLSTAKGFLTAKECLQQKECGLVLFRLDLL